MATKTISLRIPVSLWSKLLHLKADGLIKSSQEFIVSAVEEKVNLLREEGKT